MGKKDRFETTHDEKGWYGGEQSILNLVTTESRATNDKELSFHWNGKKFLNINFE
jgi:hypothetical protein